MSRYYTWIVCVGCIALCLGCEDGTNDRSSTNITEVTSGTWKPTTDATAKVIRISTPEEFFKNAKRGAVIK